MLEIIIHNIFYCQWRSQGWFQVFELPRIALISLGIGKTTKEGCRPLNPSINPHISSPPPLLINPGYPTDSCQPNQQPYIKICIYEPTDTTGIFKMFKTFVPKTKNTRIIVKTKITF